MDISVPCLSQDRKAAQETLGLTSSSTSYILDQQMPSRSAGFCSVETLESETHVEAGAQISIVGFFQVIEWFFFSCFAVFGDQIQSLMTARKHFATIYLIIVHTHTCTSTPL